VNFVISVNAKSAQATITTTTTTITTSSFFSCDLSYNTIYYTFNFFKYVMFTCDSCSNSNHHLPMHDTKDHPVV
jgi:hypothetical protein